MAVLKRASGVSYEYGGEEHSGWLPPGVAIPLPTPIRRVTLDFTIEGDEGAGYLLVFAARENPGFGNDYWFDDMADAEAMAAAWFGIGPERWQEGRLTLRCSGPRPKRRFLVTSWLVLGGRVR